MKKRATYVLLLTAWISANAQTDTTLLQEATVVESRYEALSMFQYKRADDSVAQLISPAWAVAEWLNMENSTHVRQYAPGSVASYSSRGANSAQNAILWSGFNINSAETGLTDVALVPTALFNVSMLRGGNSTTFGTGAIGSVVNLGNELKHPGWHVDFSQQLASFETFKSLARVGYHAQNVKSQTSFYHEQSQNNFPYTNQWQIPEREETREHAAYWQTHVMQEFGVALNSKNRIEVDGWMNWAERNTPNNVIAKPGTAELTDRIFRGKAGWFHQEDRTQFDVQYAYLNQWQTFEDPGVPEGNGDHLLDTNITSSHLGQVNHQWLMQANWSWQNGLLIRYDDATGSNRDGDQTTTSIQSGLYFTGEHWQAQLIMRAEWWNGAFLPVSPFAALRYNFWNHFYLSANGGYVYRIPTLNDRFWVPGGNVNLQPENGWTSEATLGVRLPILSGLLHASVTGYYSVLNDYIQWIPTGAIWSPQNVKQVEINGFDLNLEYVIKRGMWYGKIEGGYSLNHSIIQNSHLPNDESLGKQIVYQPEHKCTSALTAGYRNWFVKMGVRYVGEVYTLYTTANNTLNAYTLLDASLSKSLTVRHMDFTLIAAVNNLTNTSYQNISYFPMPGINYSLTLKFSI